MRPSQAFVFKIQDSKGGCSCAAGGSKFKVQVERSEIPQGGGSKGSVFGIRGLPFR